MRVALPVWHDRVSPVFDVARHIEIHEIINGRAAGVESYEVDQGTAAALVIERGVDLVICSAISGSTHAALSLSGVEVITDVCGPSRLVVEAYAAGRTDLSDFRVPGRRRQSDSPRTAGPTRASPRGH
jgi:predicted Fe-Mo cluster-binding NifX family protein